MQPTGVDVERLRHLARSATPREEMQGEWVNLCKSSDLHPVGYNVSFWFHARTGRVMLEYIPRRTVSASSVLPRLTCTTYTAQVAIHVALGLGIVGKGEEWSRKTNATSGLFDALYREEG